MRLAVLSTVLPLVLGVTACVAPAAPADDSLEWESALAGEAAAVPGQASPEIVAKATEVVSTIEGLLKLNQQWNERVKGGSTTPEARRETQRLVAKMRETLAAMPAQADWVTGYVQQHRDAIKAGFASELATEPVRTALGGAKEVKKLTDALNHAGGVDEVILKAASLVRDHSRDISDMIGQGKKMPIGFFCAMAATVAGANAAQENWRGVVAPMYVLLRVGAIR
jgi:hypothetical protein